jgi:hypothetical protein
MCARVGDGLSSVKRVLMALVSAAALALLWFSLLTARVEGGSHVATSVQLYLSCTVGRCVRVLIVVGGWVLRLECACVCVCGCVCGCGCACACACACASMRACSHGCHCACCGMCARSRFCMCCGGAVTPAMQRARHRDVI